MTEDRRGAQSAAAADLALTMQASEIRKLKKLIPAFSGGFILDRVERSLSVS